MAGRELRLPSAGLEATLCMQPRSRRLQAGNVAVGAAGCNSSLERLQRLWQHSGPMAA